MEDHLRFAVAYWHSFTWPGGDPFGGATFERPWFHGSDELSLAKAKADVAFDLFRILGAPFFAFHDRDVAPEGATLAESNRNLRVIADIFARKMEETGVKLLWGTANLFSNRRYMAGAATNPIRRCSPTRGAGEDGVRDHPRARRRELCAVGRPRGLRDAAQHRPEARARPDGPLPHPGRRAQDKIGFKGPILIEPKPKEPTKHQYDFDVATVYGFLKRYGLEGEVKLNLEQNHAILAGHSFEHEIALANALGHLRLARHQHAATTCSAGIPTSSR